MRRRLAQSVRALGGFAIKHRFAIQDLFVVAVAVACVGFLALEYDLFRTERAASEERLKLELDEVLVVAALLVVGLFAFAWRQARRYKREQVLRIAAEQSAYASARHDSLTGLPNRRLFTERAGDALSAAWKRGSKCAVLFIDLDNFKPVNDRLGHAAGDQLLVEIAERLTSSIPNADCIARLGGDEFAALIEFARDEEDVPTLAARRIIKEIQRSFLLQGRSISISGTVGLAIGPDSGRRAEDLIHAADLAMYEAKREQRGTIRIYEAA